MSPLVEPHGALEAMEHAESIHDNHETVPIQASLVARILLSAPVITPLPPSQVNTSSLYGIGLDQKPSKAPITLYRPPSNGGPQDAAVVLNVVVNN